MSLIPQNSTIINQNNSLVTYQPEFLDIQESQSLFDYLLHNIHWSHDEAKIYGKVIITKRKIAWFADTVFDYNYSGSSRIANPWDPEILKIKNKLETETGHTYNSCLLNLYHDGKEGMAFHSDDQNHLEKNTPVAIISLGAERFFKLRETKLRNNQFKVILEQGSLLVMAGQTQLHYQHEIPKMAAIKAVRISMTWRSMSKTKIYSNDFV